MFDLIPTHMVILAVVAVLLIGPKDLPRVMRVVGQWVGKGRAMSRHFRSAIDDMIRESELQEMEQKWKAENERIMREHAETVGIMTPLPGSAAAALAALSATARPALEAPVASSADTAHPADGQPQA
jgi:sec-independent protein translocase protein TatB